MAEQFHEPRAKRYLDFILAAMLLAIALPLYLAITLVILIDSGKPVFFRQVRAGRHGKHFTIYKFRTMQVNNSSSIKGCHDPNITASGRWLRKTGLDEIPQLINVLRGEMSLVGPRPTLPYQVKKYSKHQHRRLEARPGITGWAQINGRNSLDWPAKIDLDIWYIENYSLLLDIKILAKTVKLFFSGSQVNRDYSKDPIAGTANYVIVGAGDHGKVVADICEQMNTGNILGFLDDTPQTKEVMGYKVLASIPELVENTNPQFIIAIGQNKVRKDKAQKLSESNCDFLNVIHPSASISPHSALGKGIVIMPGAVINAGVQIGNHVIVNTASSIDHDCIIDDYVHISPGARLGGNVKVGEGAWIAIGASILPGITIGSWSVIGAGSVVNKNIPPHTVVMGVPARPKVKRD